MWIKDPRGYFDPRLSSHSLLAQRSMTPYDKSVTPSAPSWIDIRSRSTTLSLPKKLTSSKADLVWCHIHFTRDLYITFIRVIGPSKTPWNYLSRQNSILNLHEILTWLPPTITASGLSEKLTNVWSRYFGTNRIIENWHWCLGVIWRKRKNVSMINSQTFFMDCQI